MTRGGGGGELEAPTTDFMDTRLESLSDARIFLEGWVMVVSARKGDMNRTRGFIIHDRHFERHADFSLLADMEHHHCMPQAHDACTLCQRVLKSRETRP